MSEKISSTGQQTKLLMKIEDIQESMNDIKNLVQLIEVSLQKNEDDLHIVSSVHIIWKIIDSVIENDMNALGDMVRKSVDG